MFYYVAARRIINTLDEEKLIVSYAEKLEVALKATSRLSLGY